MPTTATAGSTALGLRQQKPVSVYTVSMILSLLVGFVLGAGALLFALQNNEIIALTFMGWQFTSSLAVVVLASLGMGILISILAMVPSALSNSFKIMGLKKQNKRLVQEAEAARTVHATAQQGEQESTVIDLRT